MTEYIFEVEINDLDQNQNIKKTDSSINTISFEILMKNTKNIFKKIYTSISGFKINQENGIITSKSEEWDPKMASSIISYQFIDDTCYSDNIVPMKVEECISIINKEINTTNFINTTLHDNTKNIFFIWVDANGTYKGHFSNNKSSIAEDEDPDIMTLETSVIKNKELNNENLIKIINIALDSINKISSIKNENKKFCEI